MHTQTLQTTFLCLTLMLGGPAVAQSINYGDDASEYANDGECDDRRFRGNMMSSSLDEDDIGRDATDCRRTVELGENEVLNEAEARRATQCSAIQFGVNSSEYAHDGECDDPRFEGPGTTSIMLRGDLAVDAVDCQRACEAGTIYLRNY